MLRWGFESRCASQLRGRVAVIDARLAEQEISHKQVLDSQKIAIDEKQKALEEAIQEAAGVLLEQKQSETESIQKLEQEIQELR